MTAYLKQCICVCVIFIQITHNEAENIEYRSKLQKLTMKPTSSSLLGTRMTDSAPTCMGHCNKQDGCQACVWSSGDGVCSLFNSDVTSESLDAGESGFVVVSSTRREDPG